MKPFFCYYGGKWRMARHYPAPAYPIVFEPFAGAAGYSTWYEPRTAILTDVDPVLCRLWSWLTEATPDDVRALPLIETGQDVRSLDISEGAQDLIGFWLNKGTTHPVRRPSAWMRGGVHPNSFWGAAIRERIAVQVGAIKRWQIWNAPYREWPDVEATRFIDPPYVGRPGSHYSFGSSAIDYEDLADWCRTRRGQVIVCEAQGADWLPFRALGSFKANATSVGRRSAEAIWP